MVDERGRAQIAVNYLPVKSRKWKGPIPVPEKNELPNTFAKLNNKAPLKVVFYGNSIETGYNASGFMNRAPYMPSWPELVIHRLRTEYGPQNPQAEFILIAPMLPNPDAVQNGIQSLYKPELDKLARKGIVVADITGVHAELLKHKSYQDMTGNNVNHPNDYLARWYAQFITGMLLP